MTKRKSKIVIESEFATESFDKYPDIKDLSMIDDQGNYVRINDVKESLINFKTKSVEPTLFWRSKLNEITSIFLFCAVGIFLILLSAGNVYFDAIWNFIGGILNQGVVYIWNSLLGFILPLLPKWFYGCWKQEI